MEDHITIRPDRSLLLGRQNPNWSVWDVVFHENNSISQSNFVMFSVLHLTKTIFVSWKTIHAQK